MNDEGGDETVSSRDAAADSSGDPPRLDGGSDDEPPREPAGVVAAESCGAAPGAAGEASGPTTSSLTSEGGIGGDGAAGESAGGASQSGGAEGNPSGGRDGGTVSVSDGGDFATGGRAEPISAGCANPVWELSYTYVPPSPMTSESLRAVWASGPDDVFVGGGGSALGALILHWDGNSWQEMTTPGSNGVYDLWGSSANHVVAVGAVGYMDYDGATWTSSTTLGDVASMEIRAVWGVGSSNVFLAGTHWPNGSLARRVGEVWSVMIFGEPTDPFNFYDMWGSGPNSVYAIGSTEGTAVVHFDGLTWQPHSTLDDRLSTLWVTPEEILYAAGDAGLIARFEDDEWRQQTSPFAGRITSIHGLSKDDVYAVGEQGTLLHFDGTDWGAEESPTEVGLYDVFAITDNDAYAVGNDGTILRRRCPPTVTR